MKAEACCGLEGSLIEGDAGASVCRLKRQCDQRLLVVGVGLFIVERVGEAVWWLDGTEGAADVEDVPIWRLHGDPIIGPLYRIELEALNGESGGAPPAPELLCIDERGEDLLLGHDEDLLQMELRPGRLPGFGHVVDHGRSTAASGVTPECWPMSAACHLELDGSEAGEAWPAAGGTVIEDR